VEIKRILIAIALICAICVPVYGASVAKQVDFLAAGLEQDGNALTGGKIFTYEAGTTTAKTCWTDREKATPETNPIILSSEGRSTSFCDGVYKMVIKDSSDVTLVTMDGVSYGEEGAQFTTLSSYSSLSEAVADIGGTKTVLVIDSTDTLNENVTVPSNITLMSMTRDAITLNSKTLTVNGDIWAGAFEWIIGTGTFAGSPIVQFYDPTWTASTVTDSATPSYKNITISEPTLLTPVIADFSNATHVHGDDSTGGLIAAAVRDTSRGLLISNTSDEVVSVAADEAILQDSTGAGLTAASVSLSIDITNSGAYGLDTGSEATSTWYYIWLIGNSTTHAGLLSVNSTTPTLPSGFTYKGLFGAVYNDSGDDFDAFKQTESLVTIPLTSVASAGDFLTTPSWGSKDISVTVPFTAKKIKGIIAGTLVSPGIYAAQYGVTMAADSSGIGEVGVYGFDASNTLEVASTVTMPILTNSVVWLQENLNGGTNARLKISGWEY
jgi:hypothetical protein